MKEIFPAAMAMGASPPIALNQTNRVSPLFYLSELRPFTESQPIYGYKLCLFQVTTRCCGIGWSLSPLETVSL